MSVVGQFPGMQAFRRQPVRAPINPLDKTTVVSVFPKEIIEYKHTINPGKFIIPPGSAEKPQLVIVSPSSWWREIDEDQPLLEIPVHSVQIADSLVRDYCNGVMGYTPDQASPGLFYIPGEHKLIEIYNDYRETLNAAIERQTNWYKNLIKMADSLWARSNGNPLAISDDMRLAARELGQTIKDWMKDHQMSEMTRCLACGSLKNPEYPVCMTCKAIDPTHPKAKTFKFAE